MEVSSTNNASSFSLTDDAMEIIQQIVDLDTSLREEKAGLFEALYELWRSDLLTTTKLKDHFQNNRKFIKNTTFNSFKQEERDLMNEVESIIECISIGLSYTTSKGTIIQSNPAEIEKFRKKHRSNQNKINYQFNCLVEEFRIFINNKNSEMSNSIFLKPLEPAISSRALLDRKAKEKAQDEGYKGLSTTNAEGKKKGNTKDESDEYEGSDEVKNKFK